MTTVVAVVGGVVIAVLTSTYLFGVATTCLTGVGACVMGLVGLYYGVDPHIGALLAGRLSSPPSSAAKTCRQEQGSASPPSSPPSTDPIDAGSYYEEYHGHKLEHLAHTLHTLQENGCQQFVYLAGDSSLDNKHWFFNERKLKSEQMHARRRPNFVAEAVNGYEDVLTPPRMVKDVSYWLNHEAEQRLGTGKLCTLMTSIEESTIDDRRTGLLAQDAFITDHITENDYLILSLGGNDVALNPRLRTAVNMAMLVRSPEWAIRAGVAPGFGYFVKLFHHSLQQLLTRMLAKCKPKKVLVCMIYYPDEKPSGSWADHTLSAMGYDADPATLQLVIRTLFDKISERGFRVEGTEVEAFALHRVLDGKTSGDYKARVEPSVSGGRKMASSFLDALFE